MLVAAIRRNQVVAAGLTIAGLIAAFACLWPAGLVVPRMVTPLLVVDRFALFYIGLILTGAIAVAAMTFGYLRGRPEPVEEYYILLLVATLGSAVIVSSRHLVSLFLGLSILSVSLYGLIAYTRESPRAIEAGFKYLILAAAATAFLLFGIALVYFETGTLEPPVLADRLNAGEPNTLPILGGLSLVLVGLGLELGAAPFYQWVPDVYEGAPAPVTGLIATVPKVAVFGWLLRYFAVPADQSYRPVVALIAFMAVASMFVGNLLALRQNNVKRLLGYSSVAHVGYLLVGLVAASRLAVEAVTFYLMGYFVTTLGAFAVIALLSPKDADYDELAGYRGLAWQRPWLAAALVAMLFSLAGLPLTAGFLGKYYLVTAGVDRTLWTLVIILVVNSVISLFYYLRVVVAVFAPVEATAARATVPATPSFALVGGLTLGALSVLVIWLGVVPSVWIDMIRVAIEPLP
jgi:NADH-quinone oxidoreductase subunit N